MMKCFLELHGYSSCGLVVRVNDDYLKPCDAGFKFSRSFLKRLIYDIVLSRPEDYLSIYQSMCNHNCLKCHSWYFTQISRGSWLAPEDIVKEVLKYSEKVTVWEPRSRATMWHASDLCAHCGYCIESGSRGPFCPRKLDPSKIIISPQGYGPARNIVSFTGGDLYCQPSYYIKTFKMIKREVPNMWVHIETNGYGLIPKTLELLYSSGLDSIWLDMKAFNENTYKWLCGTTNKWILELPQLIKDLGIVLEVVLLYIPKVVEKDQISMFGRMLANVDKSIPVTLLAFFPQYLMLNYRPPTKNEMLQAYYSLRNQGLSNVKIGNVSVFCKSVECIKDLIRVIGREAVSL